MLYSIQDGGTDWRLLRVLNVATGEILDGEIEWVKFSDLAWHPDGTGFYYSRFPAPEAGAEFQSLNFNQEVYFHRLGDTQEDDTLVFARPDNPEHMMFAITNRNAPRKRIIAIDLDNYAEEHWVELVPETANALSDAAHVGGKLGVEYMEDVKTAVRMFNTDGSTYGSVDLPGVGTANGFEGDADNNETFHSFSSYNEPGSIYRYDVATGSSEILKSPDLPFSPDDFTVEQGFYPSLDGTLIPMFIAHRSDLVTGGGVPTLLYGYGGTASGGYRHRAKNHPH